MRALNFRAWDKPTGLMYEVTTIDLEDGMAWGKSRVDGLPRKLVDPILMQSTGSLDTMGKEIFEGDVVEIGYYDRMPMGEVRYQGFEFALRNGYMAEHLQALAMNNWELKVLGNVYENPELMKKEEATNGKDN